MIKIIKLRPIINCDGYYPQCPKCHEELEPNQDKCKCGQLIDWEWIKK